MNKDNKMQRLEEMQKKSKSKSKFT